MKRPRNHILLRLYLQHSKSAKFYIGQIDLQYGFKIINMWYMLCTLMVIFIDEYGMMFTKCSKCHHVIMRVKIHINHRTLISQVRIHRYSISCKITTVIIHTWRLHEQFQGNIISFPKEIYCIKKFTRPTGFSIPHICCTIFTSSNHKGTTWRDRTSDLLAEIQSSMITLHYCVAENTTCRSWYMCKYKPIIR